LVPDGATVAVDGETDIAKTATCALALIAVPSVLAAVTVWVPTCEGAVYRPVTVMVPTVELPPLMLSTDQPMAELETPGKFTLNCCFAPSARLTDTGEMELVPALVTVTVALALLVVSTTLVAVTVCEPAATGAVYMPDTLMVPVAAFPPATESTDHVTAVFVVPATVTENCRVEPAATLPDV